MTIDSSIAGAGQPPTPRAGKGSEYRHRGFSIGRLPGRLAEVVSNIFLDMFSIASLKVVLGGAPGPELIN